jgi:copper chaperone NosL
LKDFEASEIKLHLSNHYTEPEALIDATQATFLISENVPSPMGAFLTAFKTKDAAKIVLNEKGGKLYSWDELLNHLKD